MAKRLVVIVVEILEKYPDQELTAKEISVKVFEEYPDFFEEKKQRSARRGKIHNDSSLVQQIASEFGPNLCKELRTLLPEVRIVDGPPRIFTLSKEKKAMKFSFEEKEKSIITTKRVKEILSEHELYLILSKYLRDEHHIYSKRINERQSSNSRGAGGNKWLFPDLVGMEDLSSDWIPEIKDCVQQYSDKKTKLWSLEVKIRIKRSDVRKLFFQAVSNSSWANFGYLVACDIDGEDTLKELRMLSSLHGIGYINFDHVNLKNSQMVIPAKERTEINWDTANRLAEQNKNFKEYIVQIHDYYRTGRIRPNEWDYPK